MSKKKKKDEAERVAAKPAEADDAPDGAGDPEAEGAEEEVPEAEVIEGKQFSDEEIPVARRLKRLAEAQADDGA